VGSASGNFFPPDLGVSQDGVEPSPSCETPRLEEEIACMQWQNRLHAQAPHYLLHRLGQWQKEGSRPVRAEKIYHRIKMGSGAGGPVPLLKTT